MTDNKDGSSKTDDDNKRMRDAERMHALNEAYLKLASEAAVKYAESTVKAIMLINGGASVSLLALIGGLAAQGKVQLRGLSLLTNSLMWFASGVLSAAIGAFLAYFAAYCGAAHEHNISKIWTPPYVMETVISRRWNRREIICRRAAILAGVISLVLFVCGMISVWYAVAHIE
jgi:hypothetical protein